MRKRKSDSLPATAPTDLAQMSPKERDALPPLGPLPEGLIIVDDPRDVTDLGTAYILDVDALTGLPPSVPDGLKFEPDTYSVVTDWTHEIADLPVTDAAGRPLTDDRQAVFDGAIRGVLGATMTEYDSHARKAIEDGDVVGWDIRVAGQMMVTDFGDVPDEAESYEDPPIACGTFALTEEEQADLVRTDPRLIPLGDAIRSARERAGKTMGEVADAMDVGVVWVSGVERGRITPRLSDVHAFLAAIGADDETVYAVRAVFDALEDSPPTPADRARSVLTSPETAILIYTAIRSGHVPLATWQGRSLVRVGTEDEIGTVSRSAPIPGSNAERWGAKCGGVPMTRDVGTEGEARAWVETRAGMSVVQVPDRDAVRRVLG